MAEREMKYIDMDRVNRRIEEGDICEPDDAPPTDVLYETLLDLLQVARNEGLTVDEIDEVLRRLSDYRAGENRERFRLHVRE